MHADRYGFGLIALTLVAAGPAMGQGGDARQLMKDVVDALPKAPFVANLKLTTPQGARELALSHKFVNGARSSFLEVTAPADLKGMRFLFIEHSGKASEQYVKIPAARRGVLVTDTARKQPFLGSAFAVADLVEPDLDAATYRFVGETTVLDRACKLVESTPKNLADALYGKVINALDPKDHLALKREFFDLKGRPLKTWQVQRVSAIDDNWTVFDQTMTDTQDHTTSRLEVVSIKFNVDLPDALFTPEQLLH
jgi:outer membrane lipoprotein-sorting protein